MQSIDAKVFSLIALATLVFVEVAKGLLPKFMEGKETKIAMLLPVLFTVGAKFAGFFQETQWIDALLWAFGGSATSGVAHDKILNPIKELIGNVLPKKPPAS